MGGDGNCAYGHKEFQRSRSHVTDRITADGRDGRPVESGRYRLVVSRACPWASRAVISRRLLGLERALPMAVTDPLSPHHREELGGRPFGDGTPPGPVAPHGRVGPRGLPA